MSYNLIKNAHKAFKRYVSNYDSENPRIKRKIIHTYNVVELSKILTKDLKLDEEDIMLAELIALLHDIGRFEQVRIYNTFSDINSIDHADFGVKLLFEDKLIRQFIEENQYDRIIEKSIKNHNKYKIEENLNSKELLHSKIIRDIDKIDILAGIITDNKTFYNEKTIQNEKITEEVYNCFKDKQTINNIYVKNDIDRILVFAAFIFDINFEKSLSILKQKQYVQKMIDNIKSNDKDTIKKLDIVKKIINDELKK